LKLVFHPIISNSRPNRTQTNGKPSYMRRMKQLSREKKAALEAAADE
jgi:hypothetical protein